MSIRFILSAAILAAFAAGAADAAEAGAPHLDGAELGLVWMLPFAAILGGIALGPLLAPHAWHAHYGKYAAGCAVAFLVPCAAVFGTATATYEFVHTMLIEYVPFIVMLLALYVVAGGVRLKGAIVGTPATNTAMLAFGTAIASAMGTTGACILLIHPMLRANAWRRHNAHVFVFFIFLVGNIGGALTPLGDPPLFIGFLEGVDFFWVTTRMFVPMLVLAVPLLAAFYLLDRHYFAKEDDPPAGLLAQADPLGVEGKINFLLLAGIVAAVLLSGVWRAGWSVEIFHTKVAGESVLRSAALLVLAALSLKLTRDESRRLNGFTWGPIAEVAKLFVGIFVTIVPAIAIIRAGRDGALGDLIALLNRDGVPANAAYFWVTGILSAFLDNAPTYLLFFNLAGGDPQALMGPLATTLLAISAGSVFMGALTYIGNAPNFMVKALAEEKGVRMPSFFGYLGWSCAFLTPPLALLTFLYF
ncbi:MAG: sodium:proton antiporter [Rhodospirillales bacterium]|nr:sodium:proton antiporter [Rhodospirillales bacterium]